MLVLEFAGVRVLLLCFLWAFLGVRYKCFRCICQPIATAYFAETEIMLLETIIINKNEEFKKKKKEIKGSLLLFRCWHLNLLPWNSCSPAAWPRRQLKPKVRAVLTSVLPRCLVAPSSVWLLSPDSTQELGASCFLALWERRPSSAFLPLTLIARQVVPVCLVRAGRIGLSVGEVMDTKSWRSCLCLSVQCSRYYSTQNDSGAINSLIQPDFASVH